jgi:hypothetical protein
MHDRGAPLSLRYGRYFGDHILARIAASMLSSVTSVRPSLRACTAVARATAIETSRKAVTGGSRLPPVSVRAGDSAASAFAAAMNIVSVRRRARTAMTPRPTPGKM